MLKRILYFTVIITSLPTLLVAKYLNKPINYPASSYNLKSGVVYLELREYRFSSKQSIDKSLYKVVARAGKGYSTLSSRQKRRFKYLAPNTGVEADINREGVCLMIGCSYRQTYGFFIDSKGKMWRINQVADIMDILGAIDSEAEVALVALVNGQKWEKESIRYSKFGSGYKVKRVYENSLSNVGACGKFSYNLYIGLNGSVKKSKKRKIGEAKYGCIAAD